MRQNHPLHGAVRPLTEVLLSAHARFTDGLAKLKPMVSTGLLWLFNIRARCVEWKTDVVTPLRQNAKTSSQLQPIFLVNLVIFLLILGL